MKIKTKILATMEIAIVLCSVLVVAIPAIAAEQTTQKTITAASASEIYEPGPLDVFGNANEDDTIDMRDTTYIKLVIFGKKHATDLADANYDRKVSMLDVGQTKLIILGKEKKLTYIDLLEEVETVNKPIKRLASLGGRGMMITRSLHAMDILVPICGSDRSIENFFFPLISEWPAVGSNPESCDFEYILSMKPDAVQPNIEGWQHVLGGKGIRNKRAFEERLPGIPIICLNMRDQEVLPQNVRTYGYILDREDEAEEFIDWYVEYLNLYKSRTEGLSEDEKPRFVMSWWPGYWQSNEVYCSGSRFAKVITVAGGKNIVDEIAGPDHPNYGHTIEVDPEWIIEQNPEYIFIGVGPDVAGYETDDPSKAAAVIEEIMNQPELAHTDAVKNGCVYMIPNRLLGGAGNTIPGSAYVAKLLYPDLFEDMDPQTVHQELVDRFCGIDFNVREHGVWMYPQWQ